MGFANLALWDRIVRLLLAMILLGLGGLGWLGGLGRAGIFLLAWFPLLTAALGWCPIYALLGVRTRRP